MKIEKIDLDTKFETYGDIDRGDGKKTGKMDVVHGFLAQKINEIITYLEDKDI